MLILPNGQPNRAQRRAMDKEFDRELPREERVKKLKERNKNFAIARMQGYAAKDWQASCKKYTPKWAVWIAHHIPPRKFVVKTMMVLNSCPLAISGGMLRWSLARMRRAKNVPVWVKTLYAIAVVGASFIVNTTGCLLCVLRFPIRWILFDPVVRFQNFMVHFGVRFKIYEDETLRMARLEIIKFGKTMDTFSYQL